MTLDALSIAVLIDDLCDQFEVAALEGAAPDIESYLRRIEPAYRSRLFQELLFLEIDFRSRRGEQATASEYLARFPGHATIVDAVFRPAESGPATRPPSEVLAHGSAPGPATHTEFKHLEPHAQGGLGQIWLADDTTLGRQVALKSIRDRFADDPESRARFLHEARVTGRLEHPGIVPVHGVGTFENGELFYSMKLVRGTSLKEAIDRAHTNLSESKGNQRWQSEIRKLLSRFVEVCNAVAYAHSRGVLHRDLKPENVMLGEFGETVIVDWGLAKIMSEPSAPLETPECSDNCPPRHTSAGSTVGTFPYMSPEQAEGRHRDLTPASDVYSLGATLYCLLTGSPTFAPTADLEECRRKLRESDYPAPRHREPRTPAALAAICMKALSPAAGDRYPTAGAMAEEIGNWMADEPVEAYREPLAERASRWCRRHRSGVRAAVFAAVVLCLGSAAGVYLWRHIPGKLVLHDPPPGASLVIDDRTYELGDSRFELPLRPGYYRIRLEAPDHLGETREVIVKRGEEKRLAGLKHETGWLSAECAPLGSEIVVDGVGYGSRIRNLELKTGVHTLGARRAGYFESPTREFSVSPNATTAVRLFMDEGTVWERRSLNIQSQVWVPRDSNGRALAIISDQIDEVVARQPSTGETIWSFPTETAQKTVRLMDLDGAVGQVVVIGMERPSDTGNGEARVAVVPLVPPKGNEEGASVTVWECLIELDVPIPNRRGLGIELAPDLNGDGVRELVMAGRDNRVRVLDVRSGETLHVIPLGDATLRETPGLYRVSDESAKFAFSLEPGTPDDGRMSYPKPVTIGCVDLREQRVVWLQMLGSVDAAFFADIDSDGILEIYSRDTNDWQIVDAQTGIVEHQGRARKGRGAFPQQPHSPYFCDVDQDGVCELLEIEAKGRRRILARSLVTGEILWSGPPNIRAIQSQAGPNRLFQAPNGELLVASDEALHAISPSDGKIRWSVPGQLTHLVVGQWDNAYDEEVIVGRVGTGISCLDPAGNIQWTLRTSLDFQPLAILPDTDGDGTNEIAVNKHAAATGVIRGPRILWRRDAAGPLIASPQLVDFDGDGSFEVAQMGRWDNATSFACFEGRTGARRWSISSPIPNNRAQALYDWDRDPQTLPDYVTLGYGDGRPGLYLSVYRGADGKRIVHHQVEERPSALYTTPAVGELTGDDHPDVVAVRWDHRDVVLIDGRDGSIVRRFDLHAESQGIAILSDLNRDGQLDVVTTGTTPEPSMPGQPLRGVLTTFLGDRGPADLESRSWQRVLGLPMRTAPVVADLDRDDVSEILVVAERNEVAGSGPAGSDDGHLRSCLQIFSAEGKDLWTAWAPRAYEGNERVRVYGRPAVETVDGHRWIIAPLGTDGVVALDYDEKRPVWQTPPDVQVAVSPVVTDIDHDGIKEVVVATWDGRLIVLDLLTGQPFWSLRVAENPISGTPGVGDLDGDGLCDIVVSDQGFGLTAVSGVGIRGARQASR